MQLWITLAILGAGDRQLVFPCHATISKAVLCHALLFTYLIATGSVLQILQLSLQCVCPFPSLNSIFIIVALRRIQWEIQEVHENVCFVVSHSL